MITPLRTLRFPKKCYKAMRSQYLPAHNGSPENIMKKSEDSSKIQTEFTNTKQILHNPIRFCNFRFCSFFYFASIILRLFRIHWSPRSGMVSTADQQTSVLWALTISLTIPVIVVSQVFCYCNRFLMISTSNEIECFWFPCSNSWSPQNASNFRFASLL